MSHGLSNVEIQRVFKDVKNDLNENFLGVFPSDKINRFVMFEKMIPEKNVLLQFQIQTKKIRQERIVGVF